MDKFIEDDGSHTLAIGVVSDVEIRLALTAAMLRNREHFSIDDGAVAKHLDYWTKYVKTGEK